MSINADRGNQLAAMEASVPIKLSDLLGLLAEADEAEHDALFSLRTSLASWAGAPDRGAPEDEQEKGQKEKTYTFDQQFVTTLKVRALSEGHAVALLRNRLHGVTANFGSWPGGEPILGEVSLVGESDLVEVTP